jgi:hypothetical protein
LRLRRLAFTLPDDTRAQSVAVTLGDGRLAPEFAQTGRRVDVLLPEEKVLVAGDTLTITIR